MLKPVELMVLRDVRAFDPGLGLDATVDAVIENGILTRLGPLAGRSVAGSAQARVLDARGRWLLPGFIELQAHLGEPGLEYKEDLASGLQSAAAGGFTRVCCSADTDPVNDRAVVTEWLLQRARAVSPVQLHPIAAATQALGGKLLSEMAALRAAGAIAVGDAQHCITSGEVLRRVLEYARDYDLPVFQHTEDHAMTAGADMNEGTVATRLGLRGAPSVAEDAVVARDVLIAGYTRGRYHATRVSTAGAVEAMRAAKSRGAAVTCSASAHHLALSEESLRSYDPNCKLVPPLRHASDVEALCRGLEEGVVDAVTSDHRPQSNLQKECEFSEAEPGAVGLSTCFALLLSLVRAGKLRLPRAVAALTGGPAAVLGLPLPALREGEPADFVLVDPEAQWRVDETTLFSKSRNSPLLGQSLTGRVELTVARGRLAFDRFALSERRPEHA